MEHNIKNISIAGVSVELSPIDKAALKGLNVDTVLRTSFYKTTFNGSELCVATMRNNAGYTPLKYKKMTEQIENSVKMPVAFLFDDLLYYERERLISQGVYFIVSDKYAFLPTLIANVRIRRKKNNQTLSPAAQYVLLYYLSLEHENETFTIKTLENALPYSYLSLSRAIVNLEDCGLCQTEKDDTGTKFIHFEQSKKKLWNDAQQFLTSPVIKEIYTDLLAMDKNLYISSINALSYYSHLNPDTQESYAVWDKKFRELDIKTNEFEGSCSIEIWKYPPVFPSQEGKVVDKLSLYLSLKNNPDARVEKELEIILEEMKW